MGTGKEIPFEIEYFRGRNAYIKWNQDGRNKTFRVEGRRSWLEERGKQIERFKSPREGLMIISMAEGGWSLFGINFFVFRDEYDLGNLWFGADMAPEVTGEVEFDGRACYVLNATFFGAEGGVTYWIDKESLVIRRIQRTIISRSNLTGVEYVGGMRTTETYSDIEIR